METSLPRTAINRASLSGLAHAGNPLQPPAASPATSESPTGLNLLNPRVGVLAGVAIAAVAGASLVRVGTTAQYEGQFQLAVEPSTSATPAPQPASIGSPATLPTPTIDYATQIKILWSPRVLAPVVQQLQAEYPELTYQALAHDLEIIHRERKQTLEVRYHNANPQQVQAVLEKVSQAYLRYSQECRSSTCQELKFVEQRLPQLHRQVELAQKQVQTFQQQHGFTDATAIGQQLSERAQAVAQQQQALQIQLAEARSAYAVHRQQLGLKSQDTTADYLLSRDAHYQQLFGRFEAIANQLATELGRTQLDAPTLQTLKQQYQQISLQLSQTAQQVVLQHAPPSTPQDPALQAQQTARRMTLQQWVDTAAKLQMLERSQGAIAQAEAALNQQVQQWATLERQYSTLQQELQTATASLNRHLNRQTDLQSQLQPQQPWQIAVPLEVSQVVVRQPLLSHTQRDISFGLILGFILVAWAMAVLKAVGTEPSLHLLQLHSQPTGTRPTRPVGEAGQELLDPSTPSLSEMYLRSLKFNQAAVFLMMAVLRADGKQTKKLPQGRASLGSSPTINTSDSASNRY